MNLEKCISLQGHKIRAENRFIGSGQAIAELDDKELTICPSDVIDVPISTKQRFSCTKEGSLVVIEVQSSSSFEEGVIIRYEDDFGRIHL